MNNDLNHKLNLSLGQNHWLILILILLLFAIAFGVSRCRLDYFKNQLLCSDNGYTTQYYPSKASPYRQITLDNDSNAKFIQAKIKSGNQALRDIQNLTCLEQLMIPDTGDRKITSLAPLAKLINLTSLDIAGTNVKDLAPLSQLTQLTSLSVFNSPVSDLTPLSNLKNLTFLNLGDNQQITNLAPLSQLTELKTLNLEGTRVTDFTPLYQLADLRQLHLANTPWSETVLNQTGPLVDPERDTNFSYPPEITRLKKALPKLRISWFQFGIDY